MITRRRSGPRKSSETATLPTAVLVRVTYVLCAHSPILRKTYNLRPHTAHSGGSGGNSPLPEEQEQVHSGIRYGSTIPCVEFDPSLFSAVLAYVAAKVCLCVIIHTYTHSNTVCVHTYIHASRHSHTLCTTDQSLLDLPASVQLQ